MTFGHAYLSRRAPPTILPNYGLAAIAGLFFLPELACNAAMLTDLDIFRSAKILVEQHGADALIEAALKADELLDAGDFDGQAVWMRIRKAVLELLKPGDGETVH